MSIPLRLTAPLLTILLVSSAVPASADPILIMGGTLTTSFLTAPDFRARYSLLLTDGSLEGQWPGGTVAAITCSCVSGTSVSPAAIWLNPEQPSELAPPPTGRLQVGDVAAGPYFSGLLRFTGDPIVLPQIDPAPTLPGEVTTLSQPFSFTASITAYPALISGPFVPDPQLAVDLIGGGTAHLRFGVFALPDGRTGYQYLDSTYEFAPVPEPASLITVGTGLGLLWSRSRRRARRS